MRLITGPGISQLFRHCEENSKKHSKRQGGSNTSRLRLEPGLRLRVCRLKEKSRPTRLRASPGRFAKGTNRKTSNGRSSSPKTSRLFRPKSARKRRVKPSSKKHSKCWTRNP